MTREQTSQQTGQQTSTQLAAAREVEARSALPAHVAGYVGATAGAGECHAEGLSGWASLGWSGR